MAAPKIVSMERTPAERKKAEEAYKAMPPEGPDYPWGLSINLGKEELAKLGVKGLPEVGEEFTIVGKAKVTRVSQSASETGNDSKSIELQITDLGVTDPDAEEDAAESSPAAKALYGKGPEE